MRRGASEEKDRRPKPYPALEDDHHDHHFLSPAKTNSVVCQLVNTQDVKQNLRNRISTTIRSLFLTASKAVDVRLRKHLDADP